MTLSVARVAACWLGVLTVGILGCGGPEPPESVYPVKGEVFYRGKPAVGALVAFHKVGADPNAGQPSGEVQDDGTFTLTSYRADDGAAPGEYQVTISWRETTGGSLSDPEYGPEKLPKKYQTPDKSGLSVSVTAGSNNLGAFQISD
jgi:hypothetical protein